MLCRVQLPCTRGGAGRRVKGRDSRRLRGGAIVHPPFAEMRRFHFPRARRGPVSPCPLRGAGSAHRPRGTQCERRATLYSVIMS